jgi:hypothetical protein
MSRNTTQTGSSPHHYPAHLCNKQKQKEMRYLITLFLSALSLGLSAQPQASGSVVSAAGHSGGNGQVFINSTFGEAFIFSGASSEAYAGQGFQTLNAGVLTSTISMPARDISVKIFPNPSTGPVYIQSEAPIGELRWFTEGGQLAGWQKEDNGRIDLSKLPAGMYSLQAKIDGQFYLLGQVVKTGL